MAASIRLYLDECLTPTIATQLRRRGIDVLSVHEAGLTGDSDANHLARATALQRVLPVVEGLDRVAAGVARVNLGVDRTASELALVRLKHVIEEIQSRGRQAEADLRARPHSADRGGLLLNLVLFWVLFLLIGSLTRGIASAILWIGVILLISAILGYVLLPKPGPDPRLAEIGRLHAMIAERQKAIAHHKELVDSP